MENSVREAALASVLADVTDARGPKPKLSIGAQSLENAEREDENYKQTDSKRQ